MTTTATLPALEVLRPGKQWVCFDKDKVPYNPLNGKEAKANDPSTWGTYEQAQARTTLSSGKFAGIGREFVKEQGITGIDLDKCIVNGQIEPWAQEIIDRLNSYTEHSPSELGVHIWVYGSIPANLGPCKPVPDGIEMYDHARYFTVTGKHCAGMPETIEDRQEQLSAFYHEVSERRKPARKQHTATRASGGDTPYGLKALADECRDVAAAQPGARNDQLNASAYNLGRLIAGHELTHSTVETDLAAAAGRAGLSDREIERTMRSGIESGLLEPRSAPVKERTQEFKVSRHTASARSTGNGHQTGTDTEALSLLSPGDTPLPDVIIGGQLRDVTKDALDALKSAEEKKPSIFVQSARLVQVACNEKRRPIIVQMGIAEVKNALTRSADYFREKKISEEESVSVPVSPPKEIAEAILALNPSAWPFPALEAIVETPVMRPDGSIFDTPGYDATTHLYYYPQAGMDMCKVPLTPTTEDIQAAVALIEETISEFPYVDQADKANAYALLLTPMLRHAIKRHVPMALIDAPKQGTGKGLLADTASIIGTGSSSPVLTMSNNEEELQKALTSLLMEGATIIAIDNVSGKLQSRHLDAVLTADTWRGRVLGQSRMVSVPQRATWLATGNNIRLGGDLARRCYRIRLDPKVSRPWMRSGFKHADLATWVTEHRAELVVALLTLARGWFVAGQPLSENTPHLGTFTGWAKMIGSILEYCGISEFLTNLENLYDDADEESAQWEAFFIAWRSLFGGEWKTTAEIVDVLKSADSAADSADFSFVNSLPEYLQIDYNESKEKNPKGFAIKLGKALEKRVDACFGVDNLRLERSKDTHTKGKKWRILADSADSSTTYAQREIQSTLIPDDDETENGNSNGLEYYPHYPQEQNGYIVSDGLTSGVNGNLPDSDTAKALSASTQLSANDELEVIDL